MSARIGRLIHVAACALTFAAIAAATGCATTGARDPASIPLPDKNDLVSAHNTRLNALPTLWASATVRFDGTDARGDRFREQAEGYLQIDPPHHLALSLGKVGTTSLYLVSDDTRYGWFDMIDGDDKRAVIGRHALATRDKAEQLGLPVPPLELIDLLGLTPIDADRTTISRAAGGRPMLITPHPAGELRMTFAPETSDPALIELVTPDGSVLASAEHERYAKITRPLSAPPEARAPFRVTLQAQTLDGSARISLYESQTRDINPAAFDVPGLLARFRIDRTLDLDAGESP